MNHVQGLLITGTDTGVGKTYVTALLARHLVKSGLRVGVYKPVCSGAETDPAGHLTWPDVNSLADAVNQAYPLEMICPIRLKAPLAPPLAAELEGIELTLSQLAAGIGAWRDRVDILLVEGVGGWLCPLTAHETIRDYAQIQGFPVLVVAKDQLGAINHTLLTLESIRNTGLPLLGVILNQPSSEPEEIRSGNAAMIGRLGGVTDVWTLSCGEVNQLQDQKTLVSIERTLRSIAELGTASPN